MAVQIPSMRFKLSLELNEYWPQRLIDARRRGG